MESSVPDFATILAVLRTVRGWSTGDLERAHGLPPGEIEELERRSRPLMRERLHELIAPLGLGPPAVEATSLWLDLLSVRNKPLPFGLDRDDTSRSPSGAEDDQRSAKSIAEAEPSWPGSGYPERAEVSGRSADRCRSRPARGECGRAFECPIRAATFGDSVFASKEGSECHLIDT